MRKGLLGVALAVMVVGMFAVSCASEPAPAPEQEEEKSSSDLPDFVMNPPMAEDALFGTGSSNMSDFSLARNAAAAEARAQIASQINAQIEQAVTNYAQESGVGDETESMNFAESITRQITSEEIQGTRIAEVAKTDDGTVWVLVEYRRNALEGILEDAVENAKEDFVRDEGAAFAEFKAQEALKQLDAAKGDS
ncbi:MAG: LPP20 family lipoprotein [Spirochaetaceae bacterium]